MADDNLQPSTPGDALPDQVAMLKRAMTTALANLDQKILERDANRLNGEVRRAQQLQAQIKELVSRLGDVPARAAFDAPLGAALGQGYKEGAPGRVESAIDKEKLRALSDSLLKPFQEAVLKAKSPLPYIAPKLSEEGRQKLIETALAATAEGLTAKQLAKRLLADLPLDKRTIETEMARETTVTLTNGYRINAEKYAETLARNTTYRAAAEGTVARIQDSFDAEDQLVRVKCSPYCCDFCLDFSECIFALTQEAAEKYGVPLLADCPNGGTPFHVNCVCRIGAFIPRKADIANGNIKTAPESVMTRDLGQGEAQKAAQAAYTKRLTADPVQYADQLAEGAAVRGFGATHMAVPDDLVGQPIPGLKVGTKETFERRGLAEDVMLAQLKADGDVNTRAQLRTLVADTLRNGDAEKTKDGFLKYVYKGWAVTINPKTGLAVDISKS